MAQNVYESVFDTESGSVDDVRGAYLEEDTELVPESESGETAPASSETVIYSETGSYDADILYQLRVTNSLLGVSIALNILFLAFFILIFFVRVIQHNVTNLFT